MMLRVSLQPSLLLSAILLGAHCAAGAMLFTLEMPVSFSAAAVTIIALSLVRSMWLHALLRAQQSVIALTVEDQESCTLQTRSGAMLPARILGSTYVTSFLTVINARPAGARVARHVLLMRDTIAPEDFRRIRVLLRWARRSPEESVHKRS
jgi:hypothetical protein